MENQINVGQYHHAEELQMNGFTLYSFYNHNYFTTDDGKVIYEHCNDNDYFEYYQIHSVSHIDDNGNPVHEETYLGAVFSPVGIFEPEYSDVNQDGTVTVDTNCN